MAKPKTARVPTVPAQFRELPNTQVGFWVVEHCPFCAATHFHAAGARLADPMERLGLTQAPCKNGEYILVRPQENRKKKSKKASRRSRWDDLLWEDDEQDLKADDWFDEDE